MNSVEIKEYKDGVRLLFVNEENYEDVKRKISDRNVPVRFWGKNKFVIDRDSYPWYLYIESARQVDIKFFNELLSAYKNNDLSRDVHEHHPALEKSQIKIGQDASSQIANEDILCAIQGIEENIERLDDLIISQFGAISEQVSVNKQPLSENIKNEFLELSSKIERAMRENVSDIIVPFLGKITGANDKVNEILDGMNSAGEIASLKKEKSQLELENKKLVKENSSLESSLKEKDDYIKSQDGFLVEEINKISKTQAELQSENEELKSKLDWYENGSDTSSVRCAIKLLNRLYKDKNKISPINCLRQISSIHSGKVVVLDSAWSSAKKAEVFEEGLTLICLLNILVDQYLPVYIKHGDNKARDVFNSSQFAAKESDTTMNKYGDYRKFEYGGRFVEMQAHLKIGANDKRSTLRVHFFIDKQKELVVIGHCGEHLPQ